MAEVANKHLFLQNHRDKCWPDGRPFSQMEAIQGLLANGALTAPASAASTASACPAHRSAVVLTAPLHQRWQLGLFTLYSRRSKVRKTLIYLSASRCSSLERATYGPTIAYTAHLHVPNNCSSLAQARRSAPSGRGGEQLYKASGSGQGHSVMVLSYKIWP